MKNLLLVAFLLFVATPTVAGNLHGAQNVSSLMHSTPQISEQRPSPASGRKLYTVKGTDAGGFVLVDSVDDGYLANGQEVLIVPLDSGGSAGVFTTLLWTKRGGLWRFVGHLSSVRGHLDVHIQQGALNAIAPLYGTNDPNCCPSKHNRTIYTLSGTQLKKIHQFTSK